MLKYSNDNHLYSLYNSLILFNLVKKYAFQYVFPLEYMNKTADNNCIILVKSHHMTQCKTISMILSLYHKILEEAGSVTEAGGGRGRYYLGFMYGICCIKVNNTCWDLYIINPMYLGLAYLVMWT